jgi:exodeoxyribonuclease V
MLTDHITGSIKKNLGHEPTAGQDIMIRQLADFILDQEASRVYIVKGYAGTGKTTLISALVKTLDEMKIKVMLLAPTGRAAKVLSGYAGKSAFTIHRKIYRQKSAKDGFGNFVLNRNLAGNMVVLVDEASMISDTAQENAIFGTGRLLADLISFVNDGQHCRLIVIGDTAQLPPVGIPLSPALDKNEMAMYMPVAGEYVLTDVVRQNKDSGILQNATIVRNQITSDILNIPVLKHKSFPDIDFINGSELIDTMENAYSRNGIEDVVVLCRSNKAANQYNNGIRRTVLGREEELHSGDLLMVVKNNYYWMKDQESIDFIANGDIVKVQKIKKYAERYGFRFALASLFLVDYEVSFEAWIMLDALMSETASMSQEDNRKLYYSILEDYAHLKSRSAQYKAVKEDEFFNALQVKYAYAVTCHKAQGGQWKTVFIDQGYVNRERVDLEYLRWLYTAITRATEHLYFVNFPGEFQEG